MLNGDKSTVGILSIFVELLFTVSFISLTFDSRVDKSASGKLLIACFTSSIFVVLVFSTVAFIFGISSSPSVTSVGIFTAICFCGNQVMFGVTVSNISFLMIVIGAPTLSFLRA